MRKLAIVAWLGWWAYAIFSYSLAAPNLILTSWAPYWRFQTWMWSHLFNHREVLVPWYIGITLVLWLGYWCWCRVARSAGQVNNWRSLMVILGVIALPLLVANNALSYDVFNYMFNAKMVVVYQVNPHVHVAQEFLDDDWVRFMHNIHTPAPYGYGWTALSLIPYGLGLGKLLITWMWFRLWSILSWLGLAVVFYWLHQRAREPFTWFTAIGVLANPLLLIEIITNSHNDLWMIWPAVAAVGGVATMSKKITSGQRVLTILVTAALLAFSISMKWASVVVGPVWLALWLWPLLSSFVKKLQPRLQPLVEELLAGWPFWASVALFIPLLTTRSQQFHPWYLSWSWAWLGCWPLLAHPKWSGVKRWWAGVLVIASISSLYRYLPFLQAGGYSEEIIAHQKLITWVPIALSMILLLFVTARKSKLYNEYIAKIL